MQYIEINTPNPEQTNKKMRKKLIGQSNDNIMSNKYEKILKLISK